MSASKPVSPKATYTTKIDGKSVVLTHVFRRRYAISVNGKAAGYITSRTYENAVARLECAASLKDFVSHLH